MLAKSVPVRLLYSPLDVQFRPSIELKETLLHEIIHAWMFLCKIKDQGDHGPRFQAKMNFINEAVFSDQEVQCTVMLNSVLLSLMAVVSTPK